MVTSKRRLPVLNSAPPDDEARPPWQWVGFGTVMIFIAWVPLAYAGAALLDAPAAHPPARETGSVARLLVATIAPLAIATFAGGFLVGRFGKPAGVREAVLAGGVAGVVAVLLTALSGPFSPLFLLIVALTAGFAGAGGAAGARGRK